MNSTLFLTGFGVYVLFLIWLGWLYATICVFIPHALPVMSMVNAYRRSLVNSMAAG